VVSIKFKIYVIISLIFGCLAITMCVIGFTRSDYFHVGVPLAVILQFIFIVLFVREEKRMKIKK